MKRRLVTLSVGLLLPSALALGGGGASVFERTVRDLAGRLGALERLYPQVWPGGEGAAVEVVLTDGTQAFLVKGGVARPTSLDTVRSRLDLRAPLGFSLDRANRRAYYLVPDLAKAPQTFAALDFITHENFHGFVQPAFWSAGVGRNQPYPVEVTPRALRHAMGRDLILAVMEPWARDQHLKDAAGYFERWKTAYPDDFEAAQGTDLMEGSASYFENRLALLDRVGPRPGPDDVAAFVRGSPGFTLGGGRDAESYPLGALAGFLLDGSAQATTWKAKVVAGTPPLNVLLDGRAAPASTIPAASVTFVEQTVVAEIERRAGTELRQAARLWAAGAPLLELAGQMRGSYSPLGFFSVEGVPDFTVVPLARATYALPDGRLVPLSGQLWLGTGSGSMLLLLDPAQLRTTGTAAQWNLPGGTTLALEQVGTRDGHPLYRVKP